MAKVRKHDVLSLLIKSIIIILTSSLVGMLLVIAYLIPTDRIRTNIGNALEQYTNNPDPLPEWASGYDYTLLDDYTDSTFILTNAAYNGPENAFQKAILVPHIDYYGVDEDIIYELDENYHGDSFVWYYARYWHGYLIFMKPLLYLMSLSGVRILNFFFEFICTCLFMYAFALKRRDIRLGVAFTLALIVLNPVSTAMNFQLAAVYNVTIGALLVVLVLHDKLDDDKHAPFLFLLVGIITVYFDFLTYPLASLGLPLFLYLALKREKLTASGKKLPLLAVEYSAFWAVGYAGMWFEKWVIEDLFGNAGESIIMDGINTFLYRSGASEEHISSLAIIGKVFSIFVIPPFLVLALLVIAVYVVLIMRHEKKAQLEWNVIVSMLFVAILPIVWYLLSRQHSYAHDHFVFRSLAGSAAAISYLMLDFAGVRKYE